MDSPAPTAGYTRRTDPELAPEFAKDPREEGFLEKLNAILAPSAERDLRDLPETFPTLHVIGAPRSGTTLLYQVVASGLRVAYINNLIAAFWRAPVYGVRLARKLGLERLESDFDSEFGRTAGITEPHEFGYFWNDRLRYPDLDERRPEHEATIDWDGLRRVIVNMADAAGAPLAFKPMLLVWHLEAMARTMPRTRYVWIRREPRDTALSLIRMRRSLRGSEDLWASLRPRSVPDDDPPCRQVAAQVLAIEATIATAAERLGPEHVLPVRYEDLCADPAAVVDEIRAMLGRAGFAPERTDLPLRPFTERRNRALDEEFGALIDAALEELGAGGGR